jgi:hypothetical protein
VEETQANSRVNTSQGYILEDHWHCENIECAPDIDMEISGRVVASWKLGERDVL